LKNLQAIVWQDKFKSKTLLRNIALAISVLLVLAPVALLFVISLKPDTAILKAPLLPFKPTFEHYTILFSQLGFARALRNSLTIALIVLAVNIPVAH
jgi:ABC-type glycerol-3-phosphate transport system permease component